MNERLLALQKQAYAYADKHTQEGDNQFAMIQLGKFAELIIQECGDVAYGAYWENPEGVRGIHLKDAILENFGVK